MAELSKGGFPTREDIRGVHPAKGWRGPKDDLRLYADWIEDLRLVAGSQIVEDMANGAEACLQLWQRAKDAAGP